ncbi:hypothetical protein ALQ74_200129 [Pseudomonas savastanoi pv. glycinea]|uniref:Uncharacterized protein n=1 Tax=Pseudomonas savastanoi pv. glycinea TaxID=318 RepID=A0A3M3FSQ6_PSESG|nr:hypothetical protein ALQ74_200129 [Pseudomonas savastanoi pv. glycinea]
MSSICAAGIGKLLNCDWLRRASGKSDGVTPATPSRVQCAINCCSSTAYSSASRCTVSRSNTAPLKVQLRRNSPPYTWPLMLSGAANGASALCDAPLLSAEGVNNAPCASKLPSNCPR